MTYPEAVASSEAKPPCWQTYLLVEADDLIDELLAKRALRLFILCTKCQLSVHLRI